MVFVLAVEVPDLCTLCAAFGERENCGFGNPNPNPRAAGAASEGRKIYCVLAQNLPMLSISQAACVCVQ